MTTQTSEISSAVLSRSAELFWSNFVFGHFSHWKRRQRSSYCNHCNFCISSAGTKFMRMTSLLPLGPNCITYGTLRLVRLGPVITLVPYYTIMPLIDERKERTFILHTRYGRDNHSLPNASGHRGKTEHNYLFYRWKQIDIAPPLTKTLTRLQNISHKLLVLRICLIRVLPTNY